MRFSCEDHQYRAFLCYRRKQTNPQFAASEDVAAMLHWWMNYGQCRAAEKPALFEECYQTGGQLTFGEEGIGHFMPQMTTCFVVLCPGFFEKMIGAFQTAMMDSWNTKQELIEKTRALLSDKNNGDVCYLELKHALQVRDRVKPVLVTVNGRDPYDGANKNLLADILGENSDQLLSPINPCMVDYDRMAEYVNGVCWREIDEADAKKRMEKLEADPAGAALLKSLRQIVMRDVLSDSGSAEEGDAVDHDAILADLQRCARTLLRLQQPSGDEKYFHAENRNIVYDPVRVTNMKNDPRIKPPFLAACLVESFRDNQKSFGLQMDDFAYWNVDLDLAGTSPGEQQSIPLSVCAVCFGTLSMHHYFNKERERMHQDPAVSDAHNPMLHTIRAGQNLLLALRNPYTKTWPSTWEFNQADAKTLGTEGTTNQTNLSLAALMGCGFLAPDIPSRFLKARYEYIWESVEVLLSWGVTWNLETGWRYTPESRNAPALLPTVFVFDTLCKLKQNISRLLPLFREDEPFHARLQQDLQTVERTMGEILSFIAVKQCVRKGEDHGAFRRFERTEFSVTHTAYVIKSLYQYMQDCGDAHGKLRRILTPAVDYLLRRVETMKQNGEIRFQDWELYEDFCDSEKDDHDGDGLKSTYGEKYEHCAELIIGEAMIKIAENTEDSALGHRVMDLLKWLVGTYCRDKRVESRDGETVRVKGLRDFLPYPIYGLYYYRMLLWDYLLLLEQKGM